MAVVVAVAAKAWCLVAGSWWPVVVGDELIFKAAIFLNRVSKNSEHGFHCVAPFWCSESGHVLGTT